MGASLQICQGCVQLLAASEAEVRLLDSRFQALRAALETRFGPLRVERHDCLLHCREGTVCLVLQKDGEARPRWAHLDPENPAEPPWVRR